MTPSPNTQSKEVAYFLKDKISHEFNEIFRIENGRDQAIIKFYEKIIDNLLSSTRQQVQEEMVSKYEADIAHAMGYCRGIGHPESYLEKKYSHLVLKETTK